MAEERRDALKIIGAISATCAFPFSADELYGQQQDHAQHAQPGPQAPAQPLRFFNAEEVRLLGVVADHIIPSSGTVSASGALVPYYIDMVVAGNKDLQRNFREGFTWLKQAGFETATSENQFAMLLVLCKAVDAGTIKTPEQRWFRSMKSLTADGYYTSRPGMVDELGYKGGSVLAAYPECVHEH